MSEEVKEKIDPETMKKVEAQLAEQKKIEVKAKELSAKYDALIKEIDEAGFVLQTIHQPNLTIKR